MSLAPGVRLGAYEIIALIGAGGMGEVYRARDSKLNRDIALKILPEQFALDADRLVRFKREAQVLASLNHPNIAAIYGFEESNGLQALVLELVEGPTLADRIAEGPLPVEGALAIARQIAEALEAAHEQGIVHRDLKPANIKVRPDGTVKVLDFGLAKAGGPERTLSQAPTTVNATMEGVILGTLAYMSPEQARGQAIDRRTDIWAFGCVLFETLTGQPAFGGPTMTDVIAAILERDPDWRALPSATPLIVRRLLARCLEKDVKKRLRDIGDAGIEFEEVLAGKQVRAAATRGIRTSLPVRWVSGTAILGAALIAAAYVLVHRTSESGSTGPSLRMNFSQLTSAPGIEWFPSLSPDGKWVVYAGEGSGNRDIYLQSVTGQTPINLTSDSPEDDNQPVFSPDGERIAFRSSREGGGIFVMGRTGESVRRVTHEGFKPTWSPDGTQLAYTTENVELTPQNQESLSELWVVNVSSGESRKLDVQDAILASWSPLGRRIAYTARSRGALASGGSRSLDLWTVSSTGGEPIAVTNDSAIDWNPVWSPDGKYLYFASDRGGAMNLWRAGIDEASGQTLGEPQAITTPGSFVAHASISADGTRIAYSSVLQTRNIQRLTLNPSTGDPMGEPSWLTTGSRSWANPDPSPDGQWVVFYSSLQPEGDIYVVRTDGTGLRQVTSEPGVMDRVPRWSPDSQWIAHFSNRSGSLQLWKIRPDGSDLRQLTEVPDATYPVWSPDGGRIAVYMLATKDHPENVYVFDPNRPWKEQTPEILPKIENPAASFVVNSWSPDGERLAGTTGLAAQGLVAYSLRSKTFERLTDFGQWPAWLPDGRQLLFVSGGKDFYVLDTKSKSVRKVFSVTRDVIGPPQLSKNGRQAYFSRRVTEADIWLATINKQ